MTVPGVLRDLAGEAHFHINDESAMMAEVRREFERTHWRLKRETARIEVSIARKVRTRVREKRKPAGERGTWRRMRK